MEVVWDDERVGRARNRDPRVTARATATSALRTLGEAA